MRILNLVMLLVLCEANTRPKFKVQEVTHYDEDTITDGQDNIVEEARRSIIEILGSLEMVDNEAFFDEQKRNYTLGGDGIMQLVKFLGDKVLWQNQAKLAEIKPNSTVLKDNEATLADIKANSTRELPKEASDLGLTTKILMAFFPKLKETMEAQYGTYVYLENHISNIFTYLEKDLGPKIIEKGVTATVAEFIPIKGWVDGSKKFFHGLNEAVAAAHRLIRVSLIGIGVHVLEGHPDKITEALKGRMAGDVGEGAWKIGRGAIDIFASASLFRPIISCVLDVFEEIVKMVDFVFQRLTLSLKIYDAQRALLPENKKDPNSILNNEASFGKWFADTVFYLPITAALSFTPKKVRSPFAFCEVLISEEEYTGKSRLITKREYEKCSAYVRSLAVYVPLYLEKFEARYRMTFRSSNSNFDKAIDRARKNNMTVEMSDDLSYGTMVNKYTKHAVVDIEIEEVVVREQKWDAGQFIHGGGEYNGEFYGYVTDYNGVALKEGDYIQSHKKNGSSLSFSCPENKVFSNGLCFDQNDHVQNGENATKVVPATYINQTQAWRIAKFNGDKINVMYRRDVIPRERKVYLEIWEDDDTNDDFAGGVPLDLEALMNFEGSDNNTYKGKVPLFNCRESKMVRRETLKFDTSCGYVGLSIKRVKYDEGKHERLALLKNAEIQRENDRQRSESSKKRTGTRETHLSLDMI